MAEKNVYTRRLSGEEIKGRFIMVMKKDLKFFPKIGTDFKLKVNDREFETRIDAVECWCMGPRKPHSHYHIKYDHIREAFDFHFAKVIAIEKLADDQYELR